MKPPTEQQPCVSSRKEALDILGVKILPPVEEMTEERALEITGLTQSEYRQGIAADYASHRCQIGRSVIDKVNIPAGNGEPAQTKKLPFFKLVAWGPTWSAAVSHYFKEKGAK